MEVTFRIPSKVVNYGYAEVKFDHQPGGSAEAMGKEYLAWVQKFQTAELDAMEAEKQEKPKASKPKPADELESKLSEELGATKVGVANPEPWEKETPPATDKPWEKAKQQAPVYEPSADMPSFDFDN